MRHTGAAEYRSIRRDVGYLGTRIRYFVKGFAPEWSQTLWLMEPSRARRALLGSINQSVWLHSGANPFTKYRIRVPRYPSFLFDLFLFPLEVVKLHLM